MISTLTRNLRLRREISKGRVEIRLAGSGGQGMVKSGIILADAIAMEGRRVLQLQSYGAEARGGDSRSDVVIGNTDYPGVIALDVLLAMNQKAYDTSISLLRPDGIVIFDSDLVRPALIEGLDQHGVPFTKLASAIGSKMYANSVALGYMIAVTGIASLNSVREAMRKYLPGKHIDANLKALEVGYRLGCTR